jgi:Dolichyl-phosphate-mannose-protein mannosyltransferase
VSTAITAPRHLVRTPDARPARARPNTRVAARAIALAPWLLLAAFLLGELFVCAQRINGPFLDEGIYVAAGLRTLQGHGISDSYLTWFSGSLLWPTIAGAGWKLWGLAGARMLAALFVTIGLAGMLKASGNLLGERVRAATALAAITSGPVIALGHLAVYDTLSVAFAGGAFWALSEFLRRDDRAWLAGAALLYALAGLSKYPVLLFIGPPLVLLIVSMRGRRARIDLGLFAFIAGAALLIYFLTQRAQLTVFESFRTANNPSFGVTKTQIVYSQVYLTAVPLLLALAGAVLLKGRRRLALALLSGVPMAPLYHLATGNPSGDQKHVVFGLLFILPLIGVTLIHAAHRWQALIAAPLIAGLALFALVQVVRIDESWPDLRPSANVLSGGVRPGDHLLVNSAWVEAAYLYGRGRVNTPYDLYDVYRTQHLGHPLNVCGFQWFVNVPGGEPWPAAVRNQMLACGTFHRIYQSSATITGLGGNLHFVTYRAPIEIWRNQPRKAVQS